MESNAVLRGNYAAKIDDKGRLKIPNAFRAVIQAQHGAELFVTSLTGESVTVYPMPVWVEIEEKLARVPSTHPARLKYFDRVNYYGQVAEIDSQGRVVIHSRLREAAGMSGEVDVFGQVQRASTSGITSGSSRSCSRTPTRTRTRGRSRISGSDAHGRTHARTGDGRRDGDAPRAVARRAVRRLHGRSRRPLAGAARGGRVAHPRPRSRPRRACGLRRERSPASATAWSWCTPTTAIWRACSTSAALAGVDGALADLGCVVDAARRRRPRLQLPARRAARHADGSLAGADRRRPDCDDRTRSRWPT